MNPPWERKGLDMLLVHYPAARVLALDAQPSSRYGTVTEGATVAVPRPEGAWVCVTLAMGLSRKEFAIWKTTGAVYTVDRHGACADDPFLVPEGSPYMQAAR